MKLFSKKVILLIEDDQILQELYLESLSQEGFVVLQALNGKRGLQLAKIEKPDLILLDIMLPAGMNGFDVLKDLKSNQETKKIPVVMLTNLESEEKTARDMGAEDYLIKANLSIEQIVDKVKKKFASVWVLFKFNSEMIVKY